MDIRELCRNTAPVNELLARYGVKFGIYKNNAFHEQLFPFDICGRAHSDPDTGTIQCRIF